MKTSLLFAVVATLSGATVALADPGVEAGKVTFGQSAALDGPAAALGQGMKLGIEAAFAEANAAGGVEGRQLELVSVDDGYEPERAIENTKSLIEIDQVFALIGAVGTPTSKAAQPIATAAMVPYIGPFTGAGFLRDPSHGNVVNYRASYGQETEAWVKHLTEDLQYDRIALLYQDDSFGRVGQSGVTAALEKRGMELVAEGSYKRNTTAVKSALLTIKKAKPQAVVMVGAYKPVAEFIKLAKKIKMDATFVNISFVGSSALAQELGEDGDGVVITQVVPFPWDGSNPLISRYQAAIQSVSGDAAPGYVSLEGYIVGRIAIEGLKRAGGDVTRDSFLSAFHDGATLDLDGLKLSYGAEDTQGSDDVYLTIIKSDGSFAAVDKLASAN